MASAGAMNQRVQVQTLVYDEDAEKWNWEPLYTSWAEAELNTRRNLFSSVGIGARGVTFTMRRNSRLTLFKSIRWGSQFCFLTSIIHNPGGLYDTVEAALVDLATCRKDPREEITYYFPGVLTEKYMGHEQQEPMAVTTTTLVLVTPKDITLSPGSLVQIGASAARNNYHVLTCHELDAYKNEYEISREADV